MPKNHRIPPPLTYFARKMRHEPTKAEKHLWSRLRRKQLGGYKFRRQHPIGPYIVDFCCVEKKLVVEADGDIYAFQEKADRERTQWLEEESYRVLRFANVTILQQTEAVLETILAVCDGDVSLLGED
ncbi:endonuclease domain-containing protein [Candidatus Leptofilum sp.]|uniref:endonuclease domain-containing protein n=1 Tax=Candidatus Leptofilum sp. TaxID=3241576 RepID=UPI003B5CD8FF